MLAILFSQTPNMAQLKFFLHHIEFLFQLYHFLKLILHFPQSESFLLETIGYKFFSRIYLVPGKHTNLFIPLLNGLKNLLIPVTVSAVYE